MGGQDGERGGRGLLSAAEILLDQHAPHPGAVEGHLLGPFLSPAASTSTTGIYRSTNAGRTWDLYYRNRS